MDIKRLSVYSDAIRPIYGPSSSHTYAPAKIAYHAASSFAEIGKGKTEVEVVFVGADSDMPFKGHASDKAIIGGMLMLDPDSEEFAKTRELVPRKAIDTIQVDEFPNVSFRFFIDKDPKKKIELEKKKAAFGIYIRIEEADRMMEVTGTSLGGGNVNIEEMKSRKGSETFSDLFLEVDHPGYLVTETGWNALERTEYNVQTFEQLVDLATIKGKRICDIAIEREAIIAPRSTRAEIFAYMKRNWKIMEKNMNEGLTGDFRGELSSKTAESLQKFVAKSNDKYQETCARAVAVSLVGASMGRIVSCPTAGSAGILPAVAYTVSQEPGMSENMVVESMFTAGIIALLVKARVSVSGMQHGCEAECGVGRAMAAALETEMRGGNPRQVVNAASRAIVESLGLPCDPIGGLVEVPCVERNGACAVAAHNDATMGLADFGIVPIEEVLQVMDQVGKDLKDDYKEGKNGAHGLAGTPTGLRLSENLQTTSPRYKIPYREINDAKRADIAGRIRYFRT